MRYKPFSFMGARQSGSFICAVGGTFETEINGYKYHIYSDVGSFNFSMSCNPSNDQLEVLVIGGGQNGRNAFPESGGGGGAGGVVFNQYVALPTGSFTMVVGAASGNSTFATTSSSSILAFGAASGQGGNSDFGSGSAAPQPSQGNKGGNAGNNGGGGAGGVSAAGSDGSNNQGGNGGDGIYIPQFAILNTIDFGTYTKFGGFPDGWYGGGGSGIGQGNYGSGGKGGGGYTGVEIVGQFDVMDAIPNTGGGGAGGGTTFGNRAGNGAKGMIIIRYRFSSI
jgi:hypothetical protein